MQNASNSGEGNYYPATVRPLILVYTMLQTSSFNLFDILNLQKLVSDSGSVIQDTKSHYR